MLPTTPAQLQQRRDIDAIDGLAAELRGLRYLDDVRGLPWTDLSASLAANGLSVSAYLEHLAGASSGPGFDL